MRTDIKKQQDCKVKTSTKSTNEYAGRAAFRANIQKQTRAIRTYNRLRNRIEYYGVTLEIDHARNVCLFGKLPDVDINRLCKYIGFERIKVIETFIWDNGEFMMILK